MDFSTYLIEVRRDVDGELARLLPPVEAPPERLHAALHHAVLSGGKRIRPTLVVLSGEVFGAARPALLPGAAALELIHAFSLVHDDLPALDDDDLRRGQPTLHRRFDEATAILAGDALLALGLTVLAERPPEVDPGRRAQAVVLVGKAIGTSGMIGGQAVDLAMEREWPLDAAAMLEWIHRRKTGALLTAAARLGGLYAQVDAATDRALAELGARLGLMFQIADDILDVEGSAGALGKSVGKDARAAKLTYPGLYGLDESKRRLAGVRDEARELAAALPGGGGMFPALIDYLARRDH